MGFFEEDLGTLKDTETTIHVKDNPVPCLFRPCLISRAMQAKVDKEIDKFLIEDVDITNALSTRVSSVEKYHVTLVDDLFAALVET